MLSQLRPSLLFITSQGLKHNLLLNCSHHSTISRFSILQCSYLFYMLSHYRTSQFITGLNKYLEAINHDFGVGMRFKMRFEGEDSPERRLVIMYRHKLLIYGGKLIEPLKCLSLFELSGFQVLLLGLRICLLTGKIPNGEH